MRMECSWCKLPFLATLTWSSIILQGFVTSNDPCSVSDWHVCDVCICSEGFIDCDRGNLTAIPFDVPRDVLYLNMDHNFITCVPVGFMEKFIKLKSLIFSVNDLENSFILPRSLTEFYANGNKIKHISLFFFHCNMLRSVYLNRNFITNIPDRTFQNCSSLDTLDISYNPIQKISNFSLTGLTSIKYIFIRVLHELHEIQSYALHSVCENLSSIFISECPNLKNLPVGLFTNCKKVISLTIDRNGITTIDPATFPWLQNLQNLYLAGNKFFNIPSRAFERFENVGILVLASVGLLEIPEKLFFNTSITSLLDLGNNLLKTVPEKLFAFPSTKHTMVTLILSGNKLESIPRKFFWSLHQLQQLHLFQNNLKQVPEGMLSFTSVTSLYLFGNQISRLTGNVFQATNSSQLNVFQVQQNPLEYITTDFLSGIGDQGEVILSCQNLQIQRFSKDVNLTCVPDTFVTSLTVAEDIGKLLLDKGFDCDIGHYFARCTSCKVGYYGSSLFKRCVPCPRGGFYQDEVGQYSNDTNIIQCKQCNNGTFINVGGGDSPLKCQVCPEGTVKSRPANFRACFCQENYYRRERFGGCHLCPGVGMSCSNDFVTIRSGYYWNWSYTDVNIYRRFVVNLQTFSNSYDNKTVNFKEPFPMVYECPQSFKCANDNDNIEGNCAKGYSGWMCTACQDGFFPILGYCHSCPTFWVFFTELLGIVFALMCFIVYLIYSYKREHSNEDRSIVDVALARGKILLGFYQIMGEFWNSLHKVYWPEVFKQVSEWFGLLQFNISSILIKPSCFMRQLILTPYTEFIIGISTPLLVLFITTVLHFVGRRLILRSRRMGLLIVTENGSSLHKIQDRLLAVPLLILFVTYTSTCNVTFALYGPACDDFSLDETKLRNISLLRSDYSIDCNTSTHRKYEIASYIASVYVVGFPAALLYLLWRHNSYNIQLNETSACSSVNPRWFRFLCENYKDRFWFWEIIELVRKMSQTFVVILFGWSSSFSITVSLILAVIFLCLHASYSPMRDKFEHYLQLASLWAIFLNMLVAAVRVPERLNSVYVQTAMTIILILLNLSVVAIVIGKTLLSLIKFMYKSCSCRCVASCFLSWSDIVKELSFFTSAKLEDNSLSEETPLIQTN